MMLLNTHIHAQISSQCLHNTIMRLGRGVHSTFRPKIDVLSTILSNRGPQASIKKMIGLFFEGPASWVFSQVGRNPPSMGTM